MCSVAEHSFSPLVSLFFFLLIPPPPRSTLFPYTTLFRSQPFALVEAQDQRSQVLAGASRLRVAANDSFLDRKSTRLNSSHQIISYAVFCLKKKKKNQKQMNRQPTTNKDTSKYIIPSTRRH